MIEKLLPHEIENKSMEIIEKELGDVAINSLQRPILKRVIHTTADFDYVENLAFSHDAIESAMSAFKNGCVIVTDTTMAMAGINKKILTENGSEVHCFIGDEDVAIKSKNEGTTRATQCMIKAATIKKPLIFAIGNAPTALITLNELVKQNKVAPSLIIGVPVGFVNVVESKELILKSGVPHIVAKGRKGGSNVAAAIVNAMLYELFKR